MPIERSKEWWMAHHARIDEGDVPVSIGPMTIPDEAVEAFELAYLSAIYPGETNFAGLPPGSPLFEAYRRGIGAALTAVFRTAN